MKTQYKIGKRSWENVCKNKVNKKNTEKKDMQKNGEKIREEMQENYELPH